MTSTFTPFTLTGPAGPLGGTTYGDLTSAAVPLLFVHPVNTDHRIWQETAASLDRPALLPALRGHLDAGADGPYGAEHWVADLVTVLDHLGVERVHAIGGSLGGSLAVLLATRHPQRVASAASFGGTLNAEGNVDGFLELLETQGVAETFRRLAPLASLGPQATPAMLELLLERSNRNDAAVVRGVLLGAMATNVVDEVSPLDVPALVACGAFDATCPPAQSALMAARLGVTAHVLPDVGHLPMIEALPETVELLRAHLDAA